MRCFVSIDLPAKIKDYLTRLQRPDIYWIKWMRPANYHITLNFLGDLNAARINAAREVLTEVSAFRQPFTLNLSRLETSRDMLWLLPDEAPTLTALQDELKGKLRGARIGKRERRSYLPHILLAKSKTGRHMRPVIENFEPQEFGVDKIHLYESELTPGAATHRLIQSFALTPASSPPHEGEKERGSG